MSKRNILGVWVAIFGLIGVVFATLAYSSEDRYSTPSIQFEQGVIPPFRG
jgi:hypothetical protein